MRQQRWFFYDAYIFLPHWKFLREQTLGKQRQCTVNHHQARSLEAEIQAEEPGWISLLSHTWRARSPDADEE